MAGESQQEPKSAPDPSVITTENILREVDHLRDRLEARMDATDLHLNERYDTQTKAIDTAFHRQETAMTTAFTASQQAVDKALTAAEKAVDHRQAQLDKEFHEHLEAVRHENALAFINSDKAIASALASQKEAVSKSEASYDKRFEAVNEFRGQLADQSRTFMPRNEYDANHKALEDRVSELTNRITRAEGKSSGYSALYGWAIGGIGLVISVILFANATFGNK